MDLSLSIITILLPLFTFFVLGLVGMKMPKQTAGIFGTLSMLVTAVVAYGVALSYFFSPEYIVDEVRQAQVVYDATWLTFGENLKVTLGIYIDPISAMMLIVISTISFMVHLYSLGYMHGEKGFQRYYAFLSLFTFSMLGLVVATNIFQMFIFFEMVGVSSYLLIGFYYEKAAAVAASKKAFIVTRFADLGFLIGIMLLAYYCDTFDFKSLMSNPTGILTSSAGVTFMGCSAASWALALIFIGGAGKSAMFPLHIWLPDAMEGPTPVSALIHAATMVVAGVFLVARMFPMYLGTPEVLDLITVTGAVTALYAAVVACAQTDIKRVLAFSTISQIAFMFTALGVARPELHEGVGYMASMFHLFTHAMFKGLLFLCAGAIIHMVHSNEMDAMGNLRKYMPITHIAFLIACLAIAGIPPFAGFFSKDEILVAAYQYSPFWGVWMSAVAGLTAFYMFRLYYRIFWWNKPDYSHHTPHDCEWVMTLPLIILAVISCVAGFIPFGSFVTYDGKELITHLDMGVAGTSVVVAVVAIVIATVLYRKENAMPDRIAGSMKTLHRAAYRRFYMDEIYQFVTHKIIFGIICKSIAWFDHTIVDGTMNALASVTNRASFAIRKLQSGSIQMYVWVYLIGALLLAAVTFVVLI